MRSARVAVATRWQGKALPVAAAAASLVLTLAGAPSAFAHAQLQESIPPSGAVVQTEPRSFAFRFDEAVQGGAGAVRVFDASGARVDDSVVTHPGGRQSEIAVGLKPRLAPGTYIATYRVVSVDTHVVSGGSVFSVGHAGGQGSLTVAGLLAESKTGRTTLVAFGVVRALDYLAIGLFVGALAFLALVWRPAVAGPRLLRAAFETEREGGEGEAERDGARERDRLAVERAFARRATAAMALATLLGALTCVLGFGLQGAEQAGVSFWSALDGGVIDEVRRTDFGWWWGTRLVDWLAIGLLLAFATRRRRSRTLGALLALAGAYLLVTVVLSGHAYSQSPRGVLIALDLAHVCAMSVWLGGLALLTFAVPAATRLLEPAERTRLLAALLRGFSPLALASVLVLASTGAIQAYVHVRSLSALTDTGYGRDVLAKTALLLGLVGLGCTQRQRILPAVRRAARERRSPGRVGFVLRRVLRTEVAAILTVLGVTAALVDYVPPVVQASGPISVTKAIGPAELELTVQPANVGLNEIHIYLLNAKTGSQYTATKELHVTASLPAKGIGAQPLKAEPTGPGHYTIPAAQFVPGGTWKVTLTIRISEFEEFSQSIDVPVG